MNKKKSNKPLIGIPRVSDTMLQNNENFDHRIININTMYINDNINDDINAYIEQNIAPIYEGITFDLFVKKTGQNLTSTELLVRGDLINPDRIKYAYYQQSNFQLTKRNNLSYSFEYPLTVGQNYSLTFSFRIQKI